MAPRSKARHKGARNDLSADRCRELFDYDQLRGTLTWKVTHAANAPVGSEAGGITKRGKGFKRRVAADGVRYLTHRVIWLWMTGEWPVYEIDHIDNDGINNKWNNLRHATSAQNLRNRGANTNNVSGLKGAYWNKIIKRYCAHINIDGKNTHIGSFKTAEEAHAAYKAAALKYHGEFARWEN